MWHTTDPAEKGEIGAGIVGVSLLDMIADTLMCWQLVRAKRCPYSYADTHRHKEKAFVAIRQVELKVFLLVYCVVALVIGLGWSNCNWSHAWFCCANDVKEAPQVLHKNDSSCAISRRHLLMLSQECR